MSHLTQKWQENKANSWSICGGEDTATTAARENKANRRRTANIVRRYSGKQSQPATFLLTPLSCPT